MYIEYEKKIAEKFGLIQKELKEAKLIISKKIIIILN